MNYPKVGDVVTGTVVRVYPSYAILLFDEGWTGLLHISELSYGYVHHFAGMVNVGSIYTVKVIALDEEKNNVRVSLKQTTAQEKHNAFHHKKIDKDAISFASLASALPNWIETQNNN